MSTRLASQPRPGRLHDVIGIVVPAVFWIPIMAIVGPAIRTPSHVDQITIDNPHTVPEVLDQGDTWIFRFTYAGQSAENQVGRDQLDQDEWQVIVPDQLADRLRAASTPETPP